EHGTADRAQRVHDLRLIAEERLVVLISRVVSVEQSPEEPLPQVLRWPVEVLYRRSRRHGIAREHDNAGCSEFGWKPPPQNVRCLVVDGLSDIGRGEVRWVPRKVPSADACVRLAATHALI